MLEEAHVFLKVELGRGQLAEVINCQSSCATSTSAK